MDYTYTYMTATSSDVPAGMAVVFGIVCGVFAIALYVVASIFMMKLFQKAGVARWKAWVPIYNQCKFLQLGGQNPNWMWLMLTIIGGIVVFIFMCIAAFNIGKKLGKSDAFVTLYALTCVCGVTEFVWLGICGLDSSKWDESQGAPSRAFETKNLANPAAPTAA